MNNAQETQTDVQEDPREPKVYALVVTRNECDRYLQACLAWHVPLFDGVLVYDDTSTDETFDVVSTSGASFTRRPTTVPTFMKHEGQFRQDSLDALEDLYELQEGDWVFVIDTDEFLAMGRPNSLREVVKQSEEKGKKSVLIPRPELWQLDPPMERVDGFWGNIKCTRLFRWEPGGKIRDVAMGCGNEPTYVSTSPINNRPHDLKLLHVGYVNEDDRKEKYQRYDTLLEHGHNDKHIQSILGEATLRPFQHPRMPHIWRGMR